jgi:hypothetical protein
LRAPRGQAKPPRIRAGPKRNHGRGSKAQCMMPQG